MNSLASSLQPCAVKSLYMQQAGFVLWQQHFLLTAEGVRLDIPGEEEIWFAYCSLEPGCHSALQVHLSCPGSWSEDGSSSPSASIPH